LSAAAAVRMLRLSEKERCRDDADDDAEGVINTAAGIVDGDDSRWASRRDAVPIGDCIIVFKELKREKVADSFEP
jgi:hypothetical protein